MAIYDRKSVQNMRLTRLGDMRLGSGTETVFFADLRALNATNRKTRVLNGYPLHCRWFFENDPQDRRRANGTRVGQV